MHVVEDQPNHHQPNHQPHLSVQFPIGIKIMRVMMIITLLLAIGMVEIVVAHNARTEYAIALIQTLEA